MSANIKNWSPAEVAKWLFLIIYNSQICPNFIVNVATIIFHLESKYFPSFHQRHLILFHENQPLFYVRCVSSACKQTFKSANSLKKHVQRKHSNLLRSWSNDNESDQGSRNNRNDNIIDSSETTEESNDQNNVKLDQDFKCKNITDMLNTLEKHFAFLLLRLKEVHILPASVHAEIAKDMQNLLLITLSSFKDVICQYLFKNNILTLNNDWAHITDTERLLQSMGEMSSNENRLIGLLKSKKMIAMPRQIDFRINNTTAVFQYIPILEVLSKLVSHEDVYNCLGDSYNHALQIQLYVDEVELCNPIGAKRGKHKVTAFYFLLGNIPSEFCSKQKFIHLALLIEHKFIKMAEYDYTEVLCPLIYDLNVLQRKGIEVSVNGLRQRLKGKLTGISADMLSAHAIGEF
ncbi:uncharacterized protein LOC105846398 [Hydra vulgaris]|uniref:uncharacterized protein LOC105846398 n=1 Tax=Hydra vulgaris TaxID=6087 RepID=UPI001F5E4BDA|nr:uncharacterized protein LOC105846398 [Hydra vulgaris]